MHGLDVSTWTYQFSDTLVCRSARCNDLPCYLPSCYRSHTTYFKRGAGAVRVIDRWERFQEMPSPKPTTQPPFICFLFLKKEEPCTLCPGMSNMVRLTCRGGTSCSLQGQGWGLMTVWSQPKSEQSLKEGCSPPSSDLHTPTASLRWLPADSAGNNPESKERHCKFDNFLGTLTTCLQQRFWKCTVMSSQTHKLLWNFEGTEVQKRPESLLFRAIVNEFNSVVWLVTGVLIASHMQVVAISIWIKECLLSNMYHYQNHSII